MEPPDRLTAVELFGPTVARADSVEEMHRHRAASLYLFALPWEDRPEVALVEGLLGAAELDFLAVSEGRLAR